MKRFVLAFVITLFASMGWSQTMIITLNDGTTVKYDLSSVKSVLFTNEDSENENTSFLIGTWSVTSAQGWGGYTGDGEAEYLQFKSDGTYINVQFDDGLYITKGNWSATDTELVMKETEGDILGTYTYRILNHTESSITLEMWGITANLTKVPDSTIEKYLK